MNYDDDMNGGAFIFFLFGVIIYSFFVSGFLILGSAYFFFCLLKVPC